MENDALQLTATGSLPSPAPPQLMDALTDEATSPLQRYQALALGRAGIWPLLRYELIVLLFGSLPGAVGFALRKLFYPYILGEVGRGVIFGRNVTIRHGHKIRLGDRVVIDEGAVLDAKGEHNAGISIGDDTIISRNCVLSCKGASLHIGRRVALGFSSLIHAVEGSDVRIGDHAAIAAFTYFIGGGNYHTERLDIPMREQGTYSKGGVVIGEGAWIGSHVQVLDGVTVGRHSIVAAGAVVHRDVPEYAVAGGVPARILRSRREDARS